MCTVNLLVANNLFSLFKFDQTDDYISEASNLFYASNVLVHDFVPIVAKDNFKL